MSANSRLLLLALALAPALSGCWSEGQADTAEHEPYLHLAEAVEVRLQPSYDIEREYAGQVMAAQTSRIGFELGGQVAELVADEGDFVSGGQVLARLDTALLQSERSELRAREAELRAEWEFARRNLGRVEKLEAERLASERERDELASRVRVLDASLQRVAAALESNDVRLEQSVLRAPFDARIATRDVDSGVVVQAGQPVFRLIEEGRLEARAGIPIHVAQRVAPGDSLTIRVDGRAESGTVIAVGAELDEATRSRSVRVALSGDHAPGNLAYLQLLDTVLQKGAWLPDTAVTEGLRGTWVAYAAVPEGDGRFRLESRSVTIQHARGGELFVSGALEDGVRIVAGGLHRFAPGQLVRVTVSDRIARVREGA